MTNHEIGEQLRRRYIMVADNLTEAVGAKPLPEAKEVRTETDVPIEYSRVDIQELQGILSELGFGRSSDLSPAVAGLQEGYAAGLQGGLGWKIDAELEAVIENGGLRHGPLTLTLSSYRKINDKEREFARAKVIILPEDATERDLGIALISIRSGFTANQSPEVLDFDYNPAELYEGYEYDPSTNIGSNNPTIIELGHINGEPVYVLQVLRAYNEDGAYRQPNTLELNLFAAELIKSQAGEYPSFMANVGSATYPSLDIAPKGNDVFAKSGIPTVLGDIKFGTRTLSKIKNEPETRPNPANTISEVDRLIKMVAKL